MNLDNSSHTCKKLRKGKYQFKTRGAWVATSSKEQHEEQHHSVVKRYLSKATLRMNEQRNSSVKCGKQREQQCQTHQVRRITWVTLLTKEEEGVTMSTKVEQGA
jgi:hypothetical protein